ncbi:MULTISPECIES: acyclic terpene utilization AtuA family protein [Tistrella]|uniref:acyclic terpene utilization AtuA family protein n=1 Tax=Tistrella TaxID=171436 RepID=UPI0031F7117A
MKRVRLGAGAGYAGDRIEPAVEIAADGDVQYLIFECLAERTIALAQQARRQNPAAGYDPLLGRRMRAVLPIAHRKSVRIISNMGAANPVAAAEEVVRIARAHGLHGLKVTAVAGDDVLHLLDPAGTCLEETGQCLTALGDRVISANAYLGAGPIVEALAAGADVVITGRVADPSLFVAPLLHEFGWAADDWARLGQATVIGHLLECAGQLTGGYFADPGRREVPGLARLGFPIAEVSADGTAVLSKVAGSGGRLDRATCTQQLLYEVFDPQRYVTPDVVADFSGVSFTQDGPDRVRVSGADGRPRPDLLKVSVGYTDGYFGEGQISYGGPGAVGRGRLALDIVAERLRLTGVEADELRFDLIGIDALHGPAAAATAAGRPDPAEIRARVIGRTATAAQAQCIGDEVETLYTNGPAGGGGVSKSVREIIGVGSTYLPRALIRPVLRHFEV